MRWPMPADATPIAVRGRLLLIQAGETRIWADAVGRIFPFGRNTTLPQPEVSPTACRRASDFNGSDYYECDAFKDLSSGAKRLIQYAPPCT